MTVRHIRAFPFSSVACIAVLIVASYASAQEESDLRKRFLAEAPKGWDAIRLTLERAQGTYSLKTTIDGKLITNNKYEIGQNSRCRMNIVKQGIQEREIVEGYNSHYSFTLTKKSASGQWLLADLNLDEPNRKKHASRVDRSISHVWLYAPVCLPPTMLLDLIKQPSFRILSVRTVQKDTLSLVEVSFDNKHNINKKPFCPIQSGRLYFDPARSWCLRSAVFETLYSNGGGSHYHDLDLTHSAPTSVIPSELIVRETGYYVPDGKTILGKKPSNRHIEVKFNMHVPSSPPPDEDFTLTAFGLPEPMGMPPVNRGVRWWLWIALAAVVSVAFAIVSPRLRRRYQGDAPEPAKT